MRDRTYVRGMLELLPAGALGIMLTGMFAALASTVDTHINWGSSYWTNDIYRRFVCGALLRQEPDPRTLVWVARGANLLIVGLALLIMTQLSSINQAWQTSLLLGAGMGTVLVLRWVWWRMSAWGELAAIGSSIVAAPLLLFNVEDGAVRLLSIAVISTGAALLAVFARGPESPERLEAFYARVRPPGFWGPVAARLGEDGDGGERRLGRALAATAAAGLSMFCLLVGAGSWIVHSPPPAWFPWATPWHASLVAVGLALCPLWVRLGFRG